MRHSGPSIDIAEGRRSLLQAKSRGRWGDSNNMRRYEKHAQLAKQFQALPASVQTFALQSEEWIANVIGGSLAPLLLPG